LGLAHPKESFENEFRERVLWDLGRSRGAPGPRRVLWGIVRPRLPRPV